VTHPGWLKNLLALACGILLLGLLELLLWGMSYPTLAGEDPFVGFSGSSPLFLPDADPSLRTTNPAKLKYFNAQTFSALKPKESFRVVAFGGSTTYGRPFVAETSFPTWFGRLLQRYAGDRHIEVINAGGISYASYRVKRLMNEMVAYQPDLFIVYSGHNEFLEKRTFDKLLHEPEGLRRVRGVLQRSRIYSLLFRILERFRSRDQGKTILGDDVDALLEDIGGPELYHRDDTFRDGVIQQYRVNLQLMAELAENHHIPLILCTLPSNLRDLSPFKSEQSAGVRSDDQEQFQRYYQQAVNAFAAEDYAGALAAGEAAGRIDSHFAELNYLLAKTADRMGRFTVAGGYYQSAKQEDIVPLRALDEMNGAVREVAKNFGVPLADVETVFFRLSPEQIPGDNLFADHVHPTLEGQQLIAWIVLDAAVKAGLVPLNGQHWQEVQEDARGWLTAELAKIPKRYRALGWWGVGRLFYWAGKYPEAYQPLKKAWAVLTEKDEIPYQLGQIELFFGNGREALAYFEAAAKLNPDRPLLTVDKASAYDLLGSPQQALSLLAGVTPASAEELVSVSYVKGRALMHLGRYEAAAQSFSVAAENSPQAPTFRLLLAEAWRAAGQTARAEHAYRAYLQLTRQDHPERRLQQWWATPLSSGSGASD